MCQKLPRTDAGVGKIAYIPRRCVRERTRAAGSKAETLDCVCPLVLRFSGGRPCSLASPLSRLILVVGSIICLAARVPVSCLPRGFSRRWEGSHQAEAAPTTPTTATTPSLGGSCVWRQTEVRRRCESLEPTEGTWLLSAAAMFVIPPFPGRKKAALP